MRSRTDIEGQVYTNPDKVEEGTLWNQTLILEALLDIRDLLIEKKDNYV